MRHRALRSVVVGLVGLAVACSGDAPEVPTGPDGQTDPVLGVGREVFQNECARCHSPDGSGGFGPKLSEGVVVDRYPDPTDQIAVVADGRRGMPAFADRLDSDEIDAVVRYTREVL